MGQASVLGTSLNGSLDHEALRRSFSYVPLNTELMEIRLLVVHPGEGNEPVRARLDNVLLSSEWKPLYETISYVWGDPNVRSRIYLQGLELDVPLSSEQAIRRMRYPDRERTLWIDAICINQRDSRERSQQVAIMSLIYSNTVLNLIWLGENEQSMAVLRLVQAVAMDAKKETKNLATFMDSLCDELGNMVITTFYSLEWSEGQKSKSIRVVQEAALAPQSELHFGDDSIPLVDVLTCALWLRHKGKVDLARTSNIEMVCRIGYYAHPRLKRRVRTFLGLLYGFRPFRTHDPLDHVFGLLGLYQAGVSAQSLSGVVVDYERSWMLVSRDATKTAIVEFAADFPNYLDYVLTDSFERKREQGRYVSWVPRWDRLRSVREPFEIHWQFDASDSILSEHNPFDSCPDYNVMLARGVRFQTVGKIKHLDMLDIESLTIFEQRFHSIISSGCLESFARDEYRCEESAGADSVTALACTLQAERHNKGRLASIEECCEQYRDYKESVALGGLSPSWATKNPPAYLQFHQAMTNRCLFVTRSGSIGLGPRDLEEDDTIAVLYGCSAPVVLRNLSEKDRYEVVGLAYVFGIMHGEVIRRQQDLGNQDEIFPLR
nr:heterokaryon incompatibility protein 6, or allele [Quercus suber]